jgi:hypothetical protein
MFLPKCSCQNVLAKMFLPKCSYQNVLAKTGQQIVPALFTEHLHLSQHIEDLEIYIPLQEKTLKLKSII